MKINTLGDLIKNSSNQFSKEPALGFTGEKLMTYSEVYSKVNSIIKFLEDCGVTKNDKVAILSLNQPNWGVAYFAIARMGAVVVPILPDFTEKEVESVLNHSEAKAIFVSETLYRKVSNFKNDSLKHVILIEKFALLDRSIDYSDFSSVSSSLDETNIVEKEYDVDEDDVASIIYTSGTTGKSKGVMLTHKNLVFSAIGSGKIHKVGVGDSMISVLPLSHTYENTIGLLLPMMYGGCVNYLRKPPVPSVLLPALKIVRPTLILTVPLIIEKVYKSNILPKFNSKPVTKALFKFAPTRKLLSVIAGKKLMETFGGRIKFFGIGGSKLDPEVERFLVEAKFPYAVGYGLTETAPLLAGFDSLKGKHQSTGPAMPGVTLKINDPDPVTNQGEIWAKGDMVMKGYYKEPELTSQVITEDGWFKTGDLGCFDKSGYLFIKGRLKNMIVGASGENIYPEEIEEIINRFNYVIESVVVQKKGKIVAMVHFNREELMLKYQNLKEQAEILIDKKIEELVKELQDYINTHVNKFSRVQMVIAHNEPFEKTATKKIKRFLYY